jgi:DNA polymerase-3 subunit epsilon
MTFTAIDFETATGYRNSACAVGIVTVEEGIVTEAWHTLIQPPDNIYWGQNIQVHRITPEQTMQAPDFFEIFPEIEKRIKGRTLVAHNESFDRSVLKNTMGYYALPYEELDLADKWECTMKIYRAKGFKPAKLDACCARMGVELNHHEALSDAKACAQLYLMR